MQRGGSRGKDKREKNGENRVMLDEGSGEEIDRDGRIVESLLTGTIGRDGRERGKEFSGGEREGARRWHKSEVVEIRTG